MPSPGANTSGGITYGEFVEKLRSRGVDNPEEKADQVYEKHNVDKSAALTAQEYRKLLRATQG
ncbi:hypothetical protein THASP1DRAFT_31230 [Thamnocephalis sphaerospora]|uniref:EF-hand domain-containing protein n=1 Tax=Thamnocephalis sphaerospora TaxID=78915 RepID=A0A4P9XM30_9FUNG|nr:hypothetical protein THASP1DRAFT_31230 [Thamnocephalis sphaerospora]|eukprot:RKP06957.1 hypothetical protein THASP1DRAFT_31230 [Thamnocephalis sphaerospora]